MSSVVPVVPVVVLVPMTSVGQKHPEPAETVLVVAGIHEHRFIIAAGLDSGD